MKLHLRFHLFEELQIILNAGLFLINRVRISSYCTELQKAKPSQSDFLNLIPVFGTFLNSLNVRIYFPRFGLSQKKTHTKRWRHLRTFRSFFSYFHFVLSLCRYLINNNQIKSPTKKKLILSYKIISIFNITFRVQ